MTALEAMEEELRRLEAQRSRYLLAAHTTVDRSIVLRRLMAVERLNEEIDSLREALASLDDHTTPIAIFDDYTIPFDVGQQSGVTRLAG